MTRESIRTALERQGLANLAAIHHHLPTSLQYEEIVHHRKARFAHLSPLVVRASRMIRRYLLDSCALGDET